MKLITDNDIERIFKMLMAAGENPFALILKKMEQEQPALVEYLFEADEEDLNDDERDLLVNVGIIAWNIIRENLGEAPVKSDDFIDLRLEINMDLFEKEQEADDGSDEHFDNLFSADNDQPMLMRFLLDIFMERPEGYQGEIRDEMVPILMLHVKTVVDCLVLNEETAADAAEEDEEEEFDEYSDEDFEEVKRMVASLYGDFRKSPFYMKMAHRDKENAELVVTAFGEMMYSYFLLMPQAWTVRRAAECCLEIMPRKILADAGFFSSLVPVLSSFLNFAAGKEGIPQAAAIAGHLPSIEADIRKNAGS